jgi:F0F1-type ATP synthase assembly protein I
MLTKGVNDKVFTFKKVLISLIICHKARFTFSYSEDAIMMRKNNRNPFQAMALMSAIVSQLVGSILIGIFAGRWLDHQWGTEPIFLIIGLLIGLASGTYAMLVSIRHFFSGDK